MSGSVAKSTRGGRRDAILDAATRLFSTRGYADTGIDDIGEAVGVTGPAVYRHFASKQDLLVAVLERATQHAEAIIPEARAAATSDHDALKRAIAGSVRACIEDRALTALYWQQSHDLPEEPRRVIQRAQRQMTEEFADIVRGVRPELSASEARMAVYAISSLMRSVATRESRVGEGDLQRMLEAMAYGALMAATPASSDESTEATSGTSSSSSTTRS